MVIGKVRITRKAGGNVVVEVQCQYGSWYEVFNGKFSEMILDQQIFKTLPVDITKP